MQHSIIVNEEKLHQAADMLEARGLIPELILKLIASSIKNPLELRLPFNASVGQASWDGLLDAPDSFNPYIQKGKSYWEIGVGANPQDKATSEFTNRTKQMKEEELLESVFVFVTPRSALHSTWTVDKQLAWIKERKESTKWKDIRILDASKITQWLYLFPGVELWLSKELSSIRRGVEYPLYYWDELKSYGSKPEAIKHLSPELFISGREIVKEKLNDIFNNKTKELLLSTRFPEEGVDIVVAYLASLDINEREAFAGRCLIISDADAWEEMCMLRDPHVFIAQPKIDLINTEANLRNKALRQGHGVIFSGISLSGAHGNSVNLATINTYDMENNLKASGYTEERARMISQKCNGNLIVMKRILLDISPSPDWAFSDNSSELAIATLIGQWNASSPADLKAIEGILGKTYGEWIGKVRPMTLRPDPPLIQKNDKWRFISRYEGWLNLGPYISDNDLERFSKVAIEVLRETDPSLSVPKEERWKIPSNSKTDRISDIMRKGIAETLILIDTFPDALKSCSVGKPQATVANVINEVFKEINWEGMASLNDAMPLLAEASPDVFLNNVIKISEENKEIFVELFKQEGSGIMGGQNYMTGLLWGLETLAWKEDFLTRVVLLLGNLAAFDPGGKWANRPFNSLVTIFLPWHPQTTASFEKRMKVISVLLEKNPEIGFNLLLCLLPGESQYTSGSYKPKWRDFIHADFRTGLSRTERSEHELKYSKMLIEFVKGRCDNLLKVSEKIDHLPTETRKELLQYIADDKFKELPEKIRSVVWESMTGVVNKHRKYSNADWVLPKNEIDEMEKAVESIKPQNYELIARRLFTVEDFELMEEKGSFEEKQKILFQKRKEAIKNIFEMSTFDGVIKFIKTIKSAFKVGFALGSIASISLDMEILPKCIDADDDKLSDFANGYIRSKFNSFGWKWADGLKMDMWNDTQKAIFFSYMPFGGDTWSRVTEKLGAEDKLYWEKTDVRLENKGEVITAVGNLIKHGYPKLAIRCLYFHFEEFDSINPDTVCKMLLDALSSRESKFVLDQHAITKFIKRLQDNQKTSPDLLFAVEWNYLPLLERHSGLTPRTLEEKLANDPSFFCEVIRAVFISEHDVDKPRNISNEKQRIAENAYDLLYKWQTVPGVSPDNVLDEKKLLDWLNKVKKECKKSGYLRIALDQVGKVFAYAPPDPEGLWIHSSIAKIIDEKEHDSMRSSFAVELFNQRAVHSYTAGREEKNLSKKYHVMAKTLEESGFINFAVTLRELAKSYERDAEREEKNNPYENFD